MSKHNVKACLRCGGPVKAERGCKGSSPKRKFCSQRCNGLYRQRSWRERFWDYVSKDPETGCWVWTAKKSESGYGILSSHGEDKAETAIASRLSWILATGSSPGRFFVCHRCDEPSCVNPDHLFLGTHQDNMDDMISKNRGRWARGEDGGQSKLKEGDVRFIRQERARGVTYADLARRFLVHEQTVKNACVGKTWRHVA
jgi:hypothetical protein